MKKKELIAGILIGVGIAAASAGFAYQGDPNVKGPNYTPERHDAMVEAFEKQDYGAWKELMENSRGRVKDVVNEDNFSKFIEARQAAMNGDMDKAKEIRAELGLGKKDGSGQGRGQGFGKGNRAGWMQNSN